MPNANEYHAGEIAVQQRAGERSIAARRGGMIGDRLVDGARAFLSRQGVAAVGAEAPDGTVWASLWNDAAGFLRAADDGEHVEVIPALDRTVDVDPVRPIVQAGAPLGMLVIDLATRQRLRINGIVTRADALGMKLRVRETFGNCNKYIQRRQRSDAPTSEVAPVTHGHALDAERRDFIARTDTAFVASIHPVRGLDVSHRGGQPGFIWVESDGTLRMPDYPGNSMFQTFGNFEVDPRAGLALIDFERGRVLSLTGNATTVFGAEDQRHPTGGTGRYWSFTVARWVDFPLPSRVRWTLIDRSPFNPLSP
jgi:predicted pyridoxine 5'-phosphate oxidase superfamily flavin-nucleotide-binding protein